MVRFYVYFATALPLTTTEIFLWAANGLNTGLYFNSIDSKLYAGSSIIALGATGVTVTTGVQYLIDLMIDISVNPRTIDAKVDGTSVGQATLATAASTATVQFKFAANVTATTFDVFYDDLWLSVTGADYPFGAGYILSYIPNADGTHNVAGANDFERTLTGTDITNATTDAYELVNDRPLESAAGDFISAPAPPNSTDYVEIAYENSAESVAPRSVEAIVGWHDAGGAGTHNFSVTLRDTNGSTTADIMAAATRNNGTSLTSNRAHFATIPGGTAWTLVAFNALVSRFLVSDASPDPYIDGLMLEAEYAPVVQNLLSEYGKHAIERGATAGINTAVRLGGWLER